MAEAIARDIIAREYGGKVRVSSAGTDALPGSPATREAVEALAESGIDLGNHRATMLAPVLVEAADLILTMTATHRRHVLDLVPGAAHKVHALSDYAGRGGDVSDPLGQPLPVYREYASLLRDLVAAALTRFVREMGGGE